MKNVFRLKEKKDAAKKKIKEIKNRKKMKKSRRRGRTYMKKKIHWKVEVKVGDSKGSGLQSYLGLLTQVEYCILEGFSFSLSYHFTCLETG